MEKLMAIFGDETGIRVAAAGIATTQVLHEINGTNLHFLGIYGSEQREYIKDKFLDHYAAALGFLEGRARMEAERFRVDREVEEIEASRGAEFTWLVPMWRRRVLAAHVRGQLNSLDYRSWQVADLLAVDGIGPKRAAELLAMRPEGSEAP